MAKRYSDDFKTAALTRYGETNNYELVADEFGVTSNTLRTWRKSADILADASTYQPVPSDSDVLNWLLLQLPVTGKWTQVRRDKWLAAYVSFIDLIIEVVDA